MSKYIIDLRPDCKVVQQICESNGQVCIGARSIQYLEELTADYINEHFGSLQDDAYKRGLEDGKAVNDKGCEGCKLQGTDSNICDQCCNSYANQWKSKDDKIEVGDEVRLCRHKVPYIVTSCDGDDDAYILMTVNGGFIKAEKYNVRKTNRHFDIKGILEAMKHD